MILACEIMVSLCYYYYDYEYECSNSVRVRIYSMYLLLDHDSPRFQLLKGPPVHEHDINTL